MRSHLIWHVIGVTVARVIEDSEETDKSEADDDIMAAVDRIVTETRARRAAAWPAGLADIVDCCRASLRALVAARQGPPSEGAVGVRRATVTPRKQPSTAKQSNRSDADFKLNDLNQTLKR